MHPVIINVYFLSLPRIKKLIWKQWSVFSSILESERVLFV